MCTITMQKITIRPIIQGDKILLELPKSFSANRYAENGQPFFNYELLRIGDVQFIVNEVANPTAIFGDSWQTVGDCW